MSGVGAVSMKKRPCMQKSPSWAPAQLAVAGITTGALFAFAPGVLGQSSDWKTDAVSPVTNPVYFEDPHVHTEIRPLFLYHNLGDDLGTGGSAQLYAVQARWAVTDRLAIIATKDGYINMDPDVGLPDTGGFANIAAGVKYAIIDNREAQFIVTPGLTIELPTGNTRVFQGNGDGAWNPFVSIGKGFGNLRILGNVGGIIPNNGNEETAQLHYSAQIDYTTCRYFIPFVSWNAFTVLSEADGPALDFEGFDLFNLGSADASGYTQSVLGVGFRSRLLDSLDFGFAYEFPISQPEGIFGDRFTIDFIWRF